MSLKAICIAWLLFGSHSLLFAQDNSDFSAAQAKLQAKTAAIADPSSTSDPEILRAVIISQNEKIATLKSRLAAVADEVEIAHKRLSDDAISEKATRQKLERLNTQVDELSKKLATSNAPADAHVNAAVKEDAVEEVSTPKLDTLGERYDNKVVKMSGLSRVQPSNSWAAYLPALKISDGVVTLEAVGTEQTEELIGFSAFDSDTHYFRYFFASKKDFGDLLVGVKNDQSINVKGTVIRSSRDGWYGLVCTNIEVVSR